MAYIASNSIAPITGILPSIAATVKRPFAAVFNFLIRVAEANPLMKEISALNEITDVELAARGTTRTDEVRRIMNGRYYI